MAEASTKQIFAAKSFSDVGANYSRPDVLQLRVNHKPTMRDQVASVTNDGDTELQVNGESDD